MKSMGPLKAIRKKCLDCAGGKTKEVSLCTVHNCPLYTFRFGTNPNRSGIGGKSRGEQAIRPSIDQRLPGANRTEANPPSSEVPVGQMISSEASNGR
jgi:hypothetical protein